MHRAVCFVVGARPNFMKAAPVVAALRRLDVPVLLVHTGQHYDYAMSDVFLDELGLPRPDVFLAVGSGTHAEQTARALAGIEAVLIERRPALVVVSGDVNSTLAGGLAAAKLQIPVGHLEAGLRSFDPTMPEEHNRRLTDHLSAILLVHSQSAVDNLLHEGLPERRIHFVGNTMIDTVLEHVDAARTRRPWTRWELTPHGFALVTLHRPALVDDPALLESTLRALTRLGADRPVVFPVHPRTWSRIAATGLAGERGATNVHLTEPLGYLDFLGLEAEAEFVLTDSGGVQEETSALGVRCFTLRDTTERPVTVELGTNIVLGSRPERIDEIAQLLATPVPAKPIPLWDGRAGSRAAAVLADFLL